MIAVVSHDPISPNTVRFWIAVSQADRDLVASSRWRAWPSSIVQPDLVAFADRRAATKVAQEQHVRHDGVGYVMFVDVRSEYLDQVSSTADGWLVPVTGVDEFNASIVGTIREQAEFQAPGP